MSPVARARIAQIGTVARHEIGRRLFSPRVLPIALLAFLPTFLFGARALVLGGSYPLGGGIELYASVYQLLVLRFIVFLGCLAVFTSLLRGDISDGSLHYWFLAPMRRDVLLGGKYVAGVCVTSLFFVTTTAVSYALLFVPHGTAAASEYLLDGPGLRQGAAYLAVTLLGCAGYGAVFLLFGVVFRNPVFPAAVLLAWEWLYFLLPPFLKKLSVSHYLVSLCPVPVDHGPVAILADPTSPWLAVPGLLAVSAAALYAAAAALRRMEVLYGAE